MGFCSSGVADADALENDLLDLFWLVSARLGSPWLYAPEVLVSKIKVLHEKWREVEADGQVPSTRLIEKNTPIGLRISIEVEETGGWEGVGELYYDVDAGEWSMQYRGKVLKLPVRTKDNIIFDA